MRDILVALPAQQRCAQTISANVLNFWIVAELLLAAAFDLREESEFIFRLSLFLHGFVGEYRHRGVMKKQILALSPSISISTSLLRPAPSWPDGSIGGALHRRRRGLVSNTRSGLNFSGLSRCC